MESQFFVEGRPRLSRTVALDEVDSFQAVLPARSSQDSLQVTGSLMYRLSQREDSTWLPSMCFHVT
eukprot:CAMPEP_0194518996 /NCGR_PEP_ID=MMETSP0253-20130528/52518_1 /TAXON_ID=2966 /ORGANISM="Noctiluca scintillans" /LENGTH=65 /DNA_ID=CAMNT_0039363081 /DNA_START=112 /DNA_END=309 /DNA_ORIENTATION=+